MYKKDGMEINWFLHRQERQKETQSHEALFCTVEQKDGQAQEGNQEIRRQMEVAFLKP